MGSKYEENVEEHVDRETCIEHEPVGSDVELDVEMERSASPEKSSNYGNNANSVVTSPIITTPRKQTTMRNVKRQGHRKPNGTAFKSLKRCSCVVLGRRYMKPSILYRLRRSSTSKDPIPTALYLSKIKACKCRKQSVTVLPPISTVLPQCKIVRAPIACPQMSVNQKEEENLNTLQSI